MSVPDWWEAVLLALAAWRTFHALAADDIFDGPRRWLTRLDTAWKKDGDPTGKDYRYGLNNFITCPYCLGLWIAVAWWAAWQIWEHGTLVVAVPLALSAGLVGADKLLSSDN